MCAISHSYLYRGHPKSTSFGYRYKSNSTKCTCMSLELFPSKLKVVYVPNLPKFSGEICQNLKLLNLKSKRCKMHLTIYPLFFIHLLLSLFSLFSFGEFLVLTLQMTEIYMWRWEDGAFGLSRDR